MNEQTAVAESSSAPAMEVDRGPLVNLTGEQRAEFRRTGELPPSPKIEESASSDTGTDQTSEDKPQGEAKTAGDTEAPKKSQEQSRRKPGAEHRIGELTSENKRLKAELETLKTPKAASEQPKPQVQHVQQQTPRQKPTAEDKAEDGNLKYQTYEDFVEDLADWKAEQRLAAAERDRTTRAQVAELQAKVDEAKVRYGAKFDEVLSPTVNAILSDPSVSPSVKAMLNDSEVLPDLLYTLGSDAKELAKFLDLAKTSPGKALRYIALTESLVREELESKVAPKEIKPPTKPQTNAPKPPSEVGGRAATPADQLEAAAKAGDFRSYKAERTRRDLARLTG